MQTAELEDLYRRHGPMVLRRCRALLRDEEKAVEAMHDVFVQCLRRQAQLEVTAPSSFLYTTATRVCLNHLRSARRRPEDPADDLALRIAQAPDQDEQAVAAQLLARLFGREQASTRTIATLHLVDGMTLEEVASEVGLSVSGVRKRLRGLREHLVELEGGVA